MKVSRLLTEKLGFAPEIERAHRIGQKEDTRTREMIVKFQKYPDKDHILANRKRIEDDNCQIREKFFVFSIKDCPIH